MFNIRQKKSIDQKDPWLELLKGIIVFEITNWRPRIHIEKITIQTKDNK